MSQENVDRLIEAIQAFNRLSEGGGEDSDFLSVMAPDIEFEPRQAALQGSYVGHAGVRQWLADAWARSAHIHYTDVRDLGDRVLALGTLRFVGRGSGIETEAPVAILASFRNGLITRLTDFGDADKALEASELWD